MIAPITIILNRQGNFITVTQTTTTIAKNDTNP